MTERNAPSPETVERWRKKGLDLRYGPAWFLHYDGRPPLDDDRDYVWNKVSRCWDVIWEDELNGEHGERS